MNSLINEVLFKGELQVVFNQTVVANTILQKQTDHKDLFAYLLHKLNICFNADLGGI